MDPVAITPRTSTGPKVRRDHTAGATLWTSAPAAGPTEPPSDGRVEIAAQRRTAAPCGRISCGTRRTAGSHLGISFGDKPDLHLVLQLLLRRIEAHFNRTLSGGVGDSYDNALAEPPKPSTACSRLRSSAGAGPGVRWKLSSSPRSNGSMRRWHCAGPQPPCRRARRASGD